MRKLIRGYKKKHQTGQTLIEVMFAVALAVFIILALVAVAGLAVKKAQFAKHQAQARAYAQETVEWLRSERDKGWVQFHSHLTPYFVPPPPYPNIPPNASHWCANGGVYSPDNSESGWCLSELNWGSDPTNCQAGTGARCDTCRWWGAGRLISGTIFAREVCLYRIDYDPNKIGAVIEVSWKEGANREGGGPETAVHKVETRTYFTNWQ
ncbi:hypothetical protein HY439_01200 [Candidatus Microgenomates bacterium]|nr:hypothetical protein [Candidatus Microgenomates bacterium]